MFRPLAIVALLSLARVTLPPDDPRMLRRQATSAVEHDSAAVLARVWTSRLAVDPADVGAMLGLAILGRLRYDYAAADSGFARLIRTAGTAPAAARYAAAARLEQGLGLSTRGLYARADSALAAADSTARRAGDSALDAEALIARAAVEARTRSFAAADSVLRRANAILPAGDADLQAAYRCRHAALLQTGGRPRAESEARAGAELAHRAADRRLHAECLRVVAASLIERGRTDSGAVAFDSVIDELAATHDRAALASALQWRGYLATSEYRFGAGRDDLLRAVREGTASGAQSPRAWALLDLCQFSARAGDLTSALRYGDSAEVLFQSQGDQLGLGILRGMQGEVAYLAGDRVRARAYIQKSLASAVSIGYGTAIVNAEGGLAAIDLDEGNLGEAQRHIDEASVAARAGHLWELDAGLTYHRARLAVRRGQFDDAERQLRLGLAAITANQPAASYEWHARLAEVLMREGRPGDAEAVLGAANDALDSVRATVGDRELRALVLQSLHEFRDPDLGIAWVIAGLLPEGRVDAAFDLSERRRARALLDRMVLHDALVRRDETPSGTLDSLRRAALRLTAHKVAGALPDSDIALLEYVTGADGAPTTLFVVTRVSVDAVRLVAMDSLAADVGRFTTLVTSGEVPQELGRRLGDALLAPALALLPRSVTRLVIVGDAGVQQLPFEALLMPDGRPLVERFSVSTAPSARVALRLWRRAPATGAVRLLAFGDPQFARRIDSATASAVYRSAFAANGGLPRLLASAGEARTVARYASQSEVRLRTRASEAFLKHAHLSHFRVLHFAAHALVDDQGPTRTALALAPGDGEDGFVTPGDLAALDLDADLVVLSACRTAGGVYVRGEGVEGLTAPLLQAGARAVLATRWQVGDQAAARFVEMFYDALADGAPTGAALTIAQRAARRRGESPGTWAAFSLVGNPDIHIPLKKPDRGGWRWLAVAVTLITVYGLSMRSGRTREWS